MWNCAVRRAVWQVLRSSDDYDVDGACEGGGIEVLVVLVWGTDGVDRTAEVVHRRSRRRGARRRCGESAIRRGLDGELSCPLPQPNRPPDADRYGSSSTRDIPKSPRRLGIRSVGRNSICHLADYGQKWDYHLTYKPRRTKWDEFVKVKEFGAACFSVLGVSIIPPFARLLTQL